ncbi:MAG: PAS domain S-box protein [Burkholderiales bacterium]|nr:PAS domain S-box protein [Burkholderiales bacterium]
MNETTASLSLQALRQCIDTAASSSNGDEASAWARVDRLAERLQQVEADLQEQSALLRTVLDESPDLIILKDQDGNFLLTNAPVARFYGSTPEAMVGKHDGDFGCPPEMAEAFRQNVQDIMARGETEIVYEESRDARTGRTSYFKSIKKPFAGPDGRPRILVIAHDITDLREAQLRVEEKGAAPAARDGSHR